MGSTEGSGGKLISVLRQKEAGAMEARGIIFKREQSLAMSKSVACALRLRPLGVLIMCGTSHIGGLMFLGRRKKDGGESLPLLLFIFRLWGGERNTAKDLLFQDIFKAKTVGGCWHCQTTRPHPKK